MTANVPAEPALDAGETLRARLALDLSPDGRFAAGELCLTDRRLLARESGTADWQAWPLHPGLTLQHADSGGLAQLSLHDAHGRLALWRFTLAANPPALALLQAFERAQRRLASPTDADEDEPAAAEDDFAAWLRQHAQRRAK